MSSDLEIIALFHPNFPRLLAAESPVLSEIASIAAINREALPRSGEVAGSSLILEEN